MCTGASVLPVDRANDGQAGGDAVGDLACIGALRRYFRSSQFACSLGQEPDEVSHSRLHA